MEFHQWLEQLTTELQQNEEVQRRAYFTTAEQEFEVQPEVKQQRRYHPLLRYYLDCSQDFYDHTFFSYKDFVFKAECRGCGKNVEVYDDPEHFEIANHWGGCGPHCIP